MALSLEPVSHEIWRSFKMHFDLWSVGGGIVKSKLVTIKELVSASLVLNVVVELVPCAVSIRMNGVEVGRADMPLGGIWNPAIDVTDRLYDGPNEFAFYVWKESLLGWGDVIVTANLVVEGDVDVETDWWADIQLWLSKYGFYVAGAGLGVAGIYMLMRRKKG